jgi:hypothetical protein
MFNHSFTLEWVMSPTNGPKTSFVVGCGVVRGSAMFSPEYSLRMRSDGKEV